jgi:hypothetical protein
MHVEPGPTRDLPLAADFGAWRRAVEDTGMLMLYEVEVGSLAPERHGAKGARRSKRDSDEQREIRGRH